MSGELTSSARHAQKGAWVRDVVVVLLLFAVGGVVAGLVWHWLWTPPSGLVVDGVWYPDEAGLAVSFGGTGLYVVVGATAGLVLGVASALLADRRELLTLGLVVLGSVLAAWLMREVGTIDVPPNPQALAPGAEDYARLPGTLEVTGASPWVALPSGALAGLCAIFVGLSRKPVDDAPADDHAG